MVKINPAMATGITNGEKNMVRNTRLSASHLRVSTMAASRERGSLMMVLVKAKIRVFL